MKTKAFWSLTLLLFFINANNLLGFFMDRRSLKNAGEIVKVTFIQARSLAITKRTTIVVILFAQEQITYKGLKGKAGSIALYEVIANKSDNSNDTLAQIGETENLPEFTSFAIPANNQVYMFQRDGTISKVFIAPDDNPANEIVIDDIDLDPETVDASEIATKDFDMEIQYPESELKCYLNVIRKNGKILFAVK